MSKSTPEADDRPNRLLIVDDALIMRRRIATIAEAAGWVIAGEAQDGIQAIELYQQLRPDLVTLDIVMPKLDGVSALKKIRELDPDARVVMVSAVNQKSKLTECIQAGVSDFIVKPFRASLLQHFFEKSLNANPGG